jgi:hypothetical protein
VVAELKAALGDDLRIELVEGARGIFDVFVANERVFSKHEQHRFPEPGEIGEAAARVRRNAPA